MITFATAKDMFDRTIEVGSRVVIALPTTTMGADLVPVVVYAIETSAGTGKGAVLSVIDGAFNRYTIRAEAASFVPRGAYIEQFLPTGTTFDTVYLGLSRPFHQSFVWGDDNRLYAPGDPGASSAYPGSIPFRTMTNVVFPDGGEPRAL